MNFEKKDENNENVVNLSQVKKKRLTLDAKKKRAGATSKDYTGSGSSSKFWFYVQVVIVVGLLVYFIRTCRG